MSAFSRSATRTTTSAAGPSSRTTSVGGLLGVDFGAGVVDDRGDVWARPVPTLFEEAHRVDDRHGSLECGRRAEGPVDRGDRFGGRVETDNDTNLTGHRADADAGPPSQTSGTFPAHGQDSRRRGRRSRGSTPTCGHTSWLAASPAWRDPLLPAWPCGRVTFAGCLGRFDAGLQRGHEVHDLRRRSRRLGQLELLPGRLLGDQVEHLHPVVVLVLGRVERGAQRLDEHLRHLHLTVAHFDALEPGQLLDRGGRDDLVGVGQCRHHQPVLDGRMAAVYWRERITNRTMATLPAASIARASSTYGFGLRCGAT